MSECLCLSRRLLLRLAIPLSHTLFALRVPLFLAMNTLCFHVRAVRGCLWVTVGTVSGSIRPHACLPADSDQWEIKQENMSGSPKLFCICSADLGGEKKTTVKEKKNIQGKFPFIVLTYFQAGSLSAGGAVVHVFTWLEVRRVHIFTAPFSLKCPVKEVLCAWKHSFSKLNPIDHLC